MQTILKLNVRNLEILRSGKGLIQVLVNSQPKTLVIVLKPDPLHLHFKALAITKLNEKGKPQKDSEVHDIDYLDVEVDSSGRDKFPEIASVNDKISPNYQLRFLLLTIEEI